MWHKPYIIFLSNPHDRINRLIPVLKAQGYSVARKRNFKELESFSQNKKILLLVFDEQFIVTAQTALATLFQFMESQAPALVILRAQELKSDIINRHNVHHLYHNGYEDVNPLAKILTEIFEAEYFYYTRLSEEKETADHTLEVLEQDIRLKEEHISLLYARLSEMQQHISGIQLVWEKLNNNVPGTSFRHSFNAYYKKGLTLLENTQLLQEHFQQVSPAFFDHLNAIAPNLTTDNLRLCAFIKLGLTNKEIAQILNVQPDSIKKSQLRIKAKLGLGLMDVSLRSYLKNIATDRQ